MKKLCIVGIVCILCISMLGCRQNTSISSFEAQVNTVTKTIVPADLPTALCEYAAWDRTAVWAKIAESTSVAVYANKDIDDAVFMQWDTQFLQLNWETARQSESDIRIQLFDADGDGAQEVAAVICRKGGIHWYKEELHILDIDGDVVRDIVLPPEQLETWILHNVRLTDGKLVCGDSEIALQDTQITAATKLADTVSLIDISLEDGISVCATIDTDQLVPLADLIVDLGYGDNTFSIEHTKFEYVN